VVLLNWRLSPSELEYNCKDSETICLVFNEEFAYLVEKFRSNTAIKHFICVAEAAPQIWAKDMRFISSHSAEEPRLGAGEEDPLFVGYTSGSTGRPKGVVQTHRHAYWNSLSWLLSVDFQYEDRVLAVLPFSHGFGLYCPPVLTVFKGCTTVIMKSFDPKRMLEIIQKEKVTLTFCAPVMLQQMSEIPHFEDYLKGARIIVGAGVLHPSLKKTLLEHGIWLRTTYGLSEAHCVSIMVSEKGLIRDGSGGQVFPLTEIRIVD